MRIRFLDFLRGAAMVAVMLIHITQLVPWTHAGAASARLFEHAMRFAVPFFIGTLGYMAAVRYRGRPLGPLYRDKALTLVLPYLCWSLAYANDPEVFDQGSASRSWFFRVLVGHSEPHLWFMNVYLGFLVLLPLLVKALDCSVPRRRKAAALVAVMAAHVAVLAGVYAALGRQQGPAFHRVLDIATELPLYWIGFFCAGALLRLYDTELGRLYRAHARSLRLLLPLFALVHLFVAAHDLNPGPTDRFLYGPWMALSTASALLLWAGVYAWLGDRAPVRWLTWLGERTLPVYLSHVLWLKLAFLYVFRARVDGMTLAGSFIAALVGSLVYIPIHARMFSTGARTKGASAPA